MDYEEKVIYSVPGVYDSLEHTSDVYIKARGVDIVELFENSGLALFDTIVNTKTVSGVLEREVEADGFDLENLLYRWLEALLFLYYSENIVCNHISIYELGVRRLNSDLQYYIKSRAFCEKFNPVRHEARVEVKSPTYSLMRIIKTESEWIAYFVLDI